MHEDSSDDPTVIVDVSRGSLDDFSTETAPAGRLIDITSAGLPSTAPQASLSRVEEFEARRRRRSRFTRVAGVGRATRRQWTATMRRLSSRARGRLVAKAVATPRAALEGQEADGVIIASLLAIVAVTYGSFLSATWRQPVEARVAAAPGPIPIAPRPAVAATVAPVASIDEALPASPSPAPAVEPVVARRPAPAMTARTLTAIWKQRDTRSLEQAFAGLRRQTLAFHRCGMRVTGDNRAVAQCDGAGGAWTIDFQRSGGRWQIADVVNR